MTNPDPRTLTWYRHIGAVTPTRYPRLMIWHQDRDLWRILLRDGDDHVAATGPPYVSKAEALSDLDRTASVLLDTDPPGPDLDEYQVVQVIDGVEVWHQPTNGGGDGDVRRADNCGPCPLPAHTYIMSLADVMAAVQEHHRDHHGGQ